MRHGTVMLMAAISVAACVRHERPVVVNTPPPNAAPNTVVVPAPVVPPQ